MGEICCIVLPEPSVIAASLRGSGKRFLKPGDDPGAALLAERIAEESIPSSSSIAIRTLTPFPASKSSATLEPLSRISDFQLLPKTLLRHVLGPETVGMITGNGAHAPVDDVIMNEFHCYSDHSRGAAWQIPLLMLRLSGPTLDFSDPTCKRVKSRKQPVFFESQGIQS